MLAARVYLFTMTKKNSLFPNRVPPAKSAPMKKRVELALEEGPPVRTFNRTPPLTRTIRRRTKFAKPCRQQASDSPSISTTTLLPKKTEAIVLNHIKYDETLDKITFTSDPAKMKAPDQLLHHPCQQSTPIYSVAVIEHDGRDIGLLLTGVDENISLIHDIIKPLTKGKPDERSRVTALDQRVKGDSATIRTSSNDWPTNEDASDKDASPHARKAARKHSTI